MNLIMILMYLCLLSTFIFFIIKFYMCRVVTNIDIVKIINDVLVDKRMVTKIKYIDESPYFNCIENEMGIKKGNSIEIISGSLHELGHAIDFSTPKKGKVFFMPTILDYILKYNCAFSLVLYGFKNFNSIVILILSVILTFMSLIYFIFILKDEIKASKNGLEVFKNIDLENNILIKIKISLLNALFTYLIALFILAIILFSQIILFF